MQLQRANKGANKGANERGAIKRFEKRLEKKIYDAERVEIRWNFSDKLMKAVMKK